MRGHAARSLTVVQRNHAVRPAWKPCAQNSPPPGRQYAGTLCSSASETVGLGVGGGIEAPWRGGLDARPLRERTGGGGGGGGGVALRGRGFFLAAALR